MIPYSRQSINDDDINEVIKVLKSDLITQGPIVQKFAKTICTYTSSNYSVLTNSATSALHIACLSLGLGKGDILWTSPNSYVASANVGGILANNKFPADFIYENLVIQANVIHSSFFYIYALIHDVTNLSNGPFQDDRMERRLLIHKNQRVDGEFGDFDNLSLIHI